MQLGEQLDIVEFSINFFERIEEGLVLGSQTLERKSIHNKMLSSSLMMNETNKISNFFPVNTINYLKILNFKQNNDEIKQREERKNEKRNA